MAPVFVQKFGETNILDRQQESELFKFGSSEIYKSDEKVTNLLIKIIKITFSISSDFIGYVVYIMIIICLV